MISAEILAIGTELLLGDNIDTNTAHIARILRSQGVNLFRTMIVGDNEERIASAINESLSRADILITTGGLGPTVDDPTRAAAARAFKVDLEFQPDLWEEIQARFVLLNRPVTENNRVQAMIPAGSIPIHNPVGTAPGFILEREEKMTASLPGVPGEMQILLTDTVIPFIQKKYSLHGAIGSRVIHCSGIGESAVDQLISDLEKTSNPTVGLLAHPGVVDIRITTHAENQSEIQKLIRPVEKIIVSRLAENIFGYDDDTLESVLVSALTQKSLMIRVLESSQGRNSESTLSTGVRSRVQELSTLASSTEGEFRQQFSLFSAENKMPNLGIFTKDLGTKLELILFWSDGERENTKTRFFAGPPASADIWIQNTVLDFIRRNLG